MRKRILACVLTAAERLAFRDGTFDVCVCRQGMQFMDLGQVCPEMFRVLKPGGRAVLCHLTAYGGQDRDETFLIQKLRNPARKNFFMPEDFPRMLSAAGFSSVESFEYLTRESVSGWTGNAAITGDAVNRIRKVYENASEAFRKIHAVEFRDGDIFDTMKMLVVRAHKKGV
jgi:SAM-dependent methyltransferase